MAYDTLKAEIRQYIKTNGANEITGQILQNVLLDMVNAYPSLDEYATQQWVQNQLSGYLPLTGGTITGDLTINSGGLTYFTIYGSSADGYANMSVDADGLYINAETTAARTVYLHPDVQVGHTLEVNYNLYVDNNASIVNECRAASFIKSGGTSSQFLKADGSVDSNTYLTSSAISDMATQTWVGQQGFLTSVPSGYATETWVGNNYLPLTGGTLTGGLTMNGTNKSIRFSTDNYVYLKRESSRLLIVNESGDDIIIGDWDDRNYITCFSDLQGGEGTSSYTSVLAQKWHILRDGSAMFSSVSQSSDIRYKINICDVNLSIENIANAPLFKFTWKDGKDGDVHIGTSAQYWQGLMPELTSENKNGVLGMQYDVAALAGVTTVAKVVVDHEARIAELEKENALLKAKLNIN